ncbi:MAG: hypothetical protein M0Z75_13005 [Nitrospiraceae bacterium]|nr:hypothetical protein [Nitrospiraceae bacterium]
MNPERAMQKGQLADIERKIEDLAVKARADIMLIRMVINPYEPDLTKLKTDEALSAMKSLDRHIEDMRALRKVEADLREALGE